MTATEPLAASAFPSLYLILVGVVVVVLLIGAFWYGSRRAAARKDPGASPSEQVPAARARRKSWHTPDDTGSGTGPPQRP
ncbi:DUF6479 family protein [Streptomyces sp. IBSNAI002]|uniref:DUF6479 family protein n=1 Tax=Streptomyces sp. IBSNAI002 TaxID=3457500 RepID=UPI003FD320D9